LVYFYYLVLKKFDAVYFVAGLLAIVVLLVCAPTTNAKSFIPLTVIDQASDGDYCNSIYICNLSDQELTFISSQDNQGYQIKDHTNIFSTGAWPQIYFAPDRYLEFIFTNSNLSSQDTILSSILTISHKVNEPQGSKGLNYDIKLEISKDGGSTWEVISTNLWPSVAGSFLPKIQNTKIQVPSTQNQNSLRSFGSGQAKSQVPNHTVYPEVSRADGTTSGRRAGPPSHKAKRQSQCHRGRT